MVENQFKIILKVESVPISKTFFQKYFCKRGGKKAYIVGEDFEVKFIVENNGNSIFEGGFLKIDIQYPNQQLETTTYKIDSLNVGEVQILNEGEPSRWGVLSPGFALFKALLSPQEHPASVYVNVQTGGQRVDWKQYPLYRDEENLINPNIAFYSIYGQMIEEFYQYWAMIGAVIAVFITVVVPPISQIFKFIWMWLHKLVN